MGKLGLSSIQKITVAIRLLSYGLSADSVDEYVRTEESIALPLCENSLARNALVSPTHRTLNAYFKLERHELGQEYLIN